MSEVLAYLSIPEMRDFMERDITRILSKVPNDPLANGEEVVFFTERMCLSVSYENFIEYYPKLWETFREKIDLSNLICKKIELIMGGENCGISGNTCEFKLTFVKI